MSSLETGRPADLSAPCRTFVFGALLPSSHLVTISANGKARIVVSSRAFRCSRPEKSVHVEELWGRSREGTTAVAGSVLCPRGSRMSGRNHHSRARSGGHGLRRESGLCRVSRRGGEVHRAQPHGARVTTARGAVLCGLVSATRLPDHRSRPGQRALGGSWRLALA